MVGDPDEADLPPRDHEGGEDAAGHREDEQPAYDRSDSSHPVTMSRCSLTVFPEEM
jgi:hypothetical protein